MDHVDKILHSYTKRVRNPRELEIWFYDYFLKLMKCFSRIYKDKTLTDSLVLLLNLFRSDFNTKVGNSIRNNYPFEKKKFETSIKEELKAVFY